MDGSVSNQLTDGRDVEVSVNMLKGLQVQFVHRYFIHTIGVSTKKLNLHSKHSCSQPLKSITGFISSVPTIRGNLLK
jgi:hypothetical protein